MTVTQTQIDEVEALARVDGDVVRGVLATIPPTWNMIQRLPAGGAFRRNTLQVLFTVQKYFDGNIWLHVSVCGRTSRDGYYLPDWGELKRVKHDFIGDRYAYQVFPEEKDYVNTCAYVLHLFSRLDGTMALPDFTWGLGEV